MTRRDETDKLFGWDKPSPLRHRAAWLPPLPAPPSVISAELQIDALLNPDQVGAFAALAEAERALTKAMKGPHK